MPPAFDQTLHAVIGLLAIMNPLGNAPIFGTMVSGLPVAGQRRAAVRTSVIILALLVVSALGGRILLEVFGVTMPAFRIAGGLIVGAMGWRMLNGDQSREAERHANNEEIRERLMVPFAMPMVAGPGTITAVVSLSAQESGRVPWATLAAIVIGSAAVLVTLLVFVRVERFVHRDALRVLTRFMGMILVAIGVQFVVAGWAEAMTPAAAGG